MNTFYQAVKVVVPVVLCLGLALPALGSPYSDTILADNPAGYWRLGESAGVTAVDEMGSNDGTYLNGVTLGQPGAIADDSDLAAGFDGVDDKTDIPWSATLNPPSFSFECWAKYTGGTSHRSPMTSRSHTGGAKGYIFYAEGGNWEFWSGPGWQALHAPAGSVVTDEWAHLVGTYDATTQEKSLYVNGQLAGSVIYPITPNPDNPLRIGAGATEGSGNYFFQGDVDEAAVYNAALSPGQVANHYATGFTGVVPPMADLVVYHLDEESGNTVRDSTMNHAHGTNNGATRTAGKFDGGLSFDGSDDYVQISSFPAGTYSELTAELWVNIADKQGKQVMLNDQSGDTVWMNFDTYGNDKLNLYLGDTSNRGYHSSNAVVPRGVWAHLAFTYDDDVDELKLYIGGQLDRTISTSGILNFDSTFRLGINESGSNQFKGLIDEVAIYSQALAPEVILARALGGPPRATPEPGALVLLALGGLCLAACARWRNRRHGPPTSTSVPQG